MVIAATGFPSLKPIFSLTQFISASTLSCCLSKKDALGCAKLPYSLGAGVP
jgi:hypothetical protein